jgi:hypothetical protein
MYRDSVDALMRLLSGVDDEGLPMELPDIAAISSTIRTLKNGIRHCCVQVLFESGAQYKIDAFGEEADMLYLKARTHPMSKLLTAQL